MQFETLLALLLDAGCVITESKYPDWILPDGRGLEMERFDDEGKYLHHGSLLNLLGFTNVHLNNDEGATWSVVHTLCVKYKMVRASGGYFHCWSSTQYSAIESHLLKTDQDKSTFEVDVATKGKCYVIRGLSNDDFSLAKAIATCSDFRDGDWGDGVEPNEDLIEFLDSIIVEDIDAEV